MKTLLLPRAYIAFLRALILPFKPLPWRPNIAGFPVSKTPTLRSVKGRFDERNKGFPITHLTRSQFWQYFTVRVRSTHVLSVYYLNKPECNLSNFQQIIHGKRGEHERRTLRGKKLPLFSRAPSSSSLLCRSLKISRVPVWNTATVKSLERDNLFTLSFSSVFESKILFEREFDEGNRSFPII